MTTEWTYCPHCGRSKYNTMKTDKTRRFCKKCHQEWFTDIDYTSVVSDKLKLAYDDKIGEPKRIIAAGRLEKKYSDKLFQASCAAMQGLLTATFNDVQYTREFLVRESVATARALLRELENEENK